MNCKGHYLRSSAYYAFAPKFNPRPFGEEAKVLICPPLRSTSFQNPTSTWLSFRCAFIRFYSQSAISSLCIKLRKLRSDFTKHTLDISSHFIIYVKLTSQVTLSLYRPLHIYKIYKMLHIKTLKTLRHISVLGPSSGSYIVLAKITLLKVTLISLFHFTNSLHLWC